MRNQFRSFLFLSLILVCVASLSLVINILALTPEEDTVALKSNSYEESQVSLTHKSNSWVEDKLEEEQTGEKDESVTEDEAIQAVQQNQEAEEAEHEEVELASMSAEVAFKQYPVRTVVATGYTAGYESTGKTADHPLYGVTFSGLTVQRDVVSTIAADPNIFPLGTVMYVPDYGYGIVMDTGGAIKGNKIDLYYETVDEVYSEWGKKSTEVYVIQMGDGSVSEEDLEYWKNEIESEALPVFNE
ncbi:3D domain-containing protein [Aquisalibacillus elongatus]|uniref:3D (Asp-Asp-Asp) domain-containing protein n=1 Tax=Aquisalibacillus elongatus TaxID=485577 RepID=A0A3N5BS41_9BACI|nr:3D domain-containing protein [Aquisalibacillus elongatus]RPF50312.1 3D (Asp-Asp-Asp) domain-containing protein [Aquisalibacillus elongatus]